MSLALVLQAGWLDLLLAGVGILALVRGDNQSTTDVLGH
jgi:hypothetical protein